MTHTGQTIQKRESTDMRQKETMASGKIFTPLVDIIETNNDFILKADMPGVNEKSIKISLDKNELTIRGKVAMEFPKEMDMIYKEYEAGDYERTFLITENIDRDKIEASYHNGVLQVKLPKSEKAKPREIEIKTN